MTATQVRVGRTSPALLLPLALIIILLGVALELAHVAPSRATGGIYQVIVGEGPSRFTISTESLSCNRTGDSARCTVPVAGAPLEITIRYSGFASDCRAQHRDRMVPCASGLGDIGEASHTVWISDSLGATAKPPVPWWRTPDGPTNAALVLIAALAIAAGLGSSSISRRTVPHPLRAPAALGTGVLGVILIAASELIVSGGRSVDWPMLISPAALLAGAALAAWQYQLGGVGTRRAKGIGAALATATYTAIAAYLFLQHSGFIS